MRVFVTGATGALGRHLVPGLVAAGHEVTATTRTPGKVAQLRRTGAEPVILNGLDRQTVMAVVQATAPEVIVHQMTALADMRSLRKVDRVFADTNELRTQGTDNLLAAAVRAGTRRVIAQSYAGWPSERIGGPVKTEEDPLDSRPVSSSVSRGAPGVYNVVDSDPAPVADWLPYLAGVAGARPPLRVPAWFGRLLAGEFVLVQMTSARGSSNAKARKELGWEPRFASWREGFRAWVSG
jgi:nucleoside-diphosphate-sugar epimerase